MFDRLLSAGVALVLGFLVWLHARNRGEETIDNAPIPVLIALPPGEDERYELELNGPSQVLATFTGPPSRMRELRGMLQRGELAVTMPFAVPAEHASDPRFLDTVRVRAEDLPAVAGVHATVLEGQNRIPLTVRRLIERPVTVKLDHALEDRCGACQIEPPTVVVRGPQEVVEHLTAIPTRPYTLPRQTPTNALNEVTARSTIELVSEIDGRTVTTEPAKVSVRVTLRPTRKQYELRLPVRFLCPADFPWEPRWVKAGPDAGVVTVRVTGPAGAEPPAVAAFVDLGRRELPPAGASLKPRLVADEPIQVQLPKEFQLTQCPPCAEAFQLWPRPPHPPERLTAP